LKTGLGVALFVKGHVGCKYLEEEVVFQGLVDVEKSVFDVVVYLYNISQIKTLIRALFTYLTRKALLY
jgi:hypothetical protein